MKKSSEGPVLKDFLAECAIVPSWMRFTATVVFALFFLLCWSVAHAQNNLQTLHSFGNAERSYGGPSSQALLGSDQRFYWTVSRGGRNQGAILSANMDGSGLREIYAFDGSEGGWPSGELFEGKEGALYGTTYLGLGIFKVNKDGTGFQMLRKFAYEEGSYQSPGLIEGKDGMLYGTANQGGPSGDGTVFRVRKDGTGFGILWAFGGTTNAGRLEGKLMEGSDGALYGVTYYGGVSSYGRVFKLNKDGSGFTVLHKFDLLPDGGGPIGGLLEASDGFLYGTTSFRGTNNSGTVYKLKKDGTGFAVLYSFNGSTYYCRNALIEGGNGALYGVRSYPRDRSLGSANVFKVNKDGTGFYQSFWSYGEVAHGLTKDGAGMLYGLSYGNDMGQLFRFNPSTLGYSILARFGIAGGDASNPDSGVIEASDGRLYGTTSLGGTNFGGAIFGINTDGSDYRVLHSFNNAGRRQLFGLTEDTDGMLYGATCENAVAKFFAMNKDGTGFHILAESLETSCPSGRMIIGNKGELFGITNDALIRINRTGGTSTVLFRSNGGSLVPIIQGKDGNFYGGTLFGNNSLGELDTGTLYRLNPNKGDYTMLRHFSGPDGQDPNGPLLEGSDEFLYGTTEHGGAFGLGAAFKISKNGENFTLLHSFKQGEAFFPNSGLVEGFDGNLYGTTLGSDGISGGTVYRVKKDGSSFLVLSKFQTTTGIFSPAPIGGLFVGSEGAFYGTLPSDGAMNLGTVFRVVARPGWFGIRRQAASVSLSFFGTPGQTYQIEAATALNGAPWKVIATRVADSNYSIYFNDFGASNYTSRFYRTVNPKSE